MAFFEEEHFTGNFHFQADVVNILCNPALQKKTHVAKVVEELRANPPYYPDDKDLAASMKEALEKVERSLVKE
jgi:hypothetical protein